MPVVPPPVFALAAGIAQHLLAPDRPAGGARKLASAGIAVAALGLDASAVAAFRRHHTTVNPLDPARASSMVTGGAYRLTRNPMYVGMAGLLTAHAVRRGGWLTPLPAAAFVVLVDRLQIPAEEAAMEANFGEAYARYRARVSRWLPVRA
ncbi:methyltransferase family protein [Nocardioides daeguensis]|uniref:Isoprenylcysteine carboxylmethyltransferase family protein n=1 Tax=Nocardioides daeguensis TaxID=908359 RepID=A0ABP6VG83_9ACTN|nr:isoprenylcysteine carboxylmethyltransferase family protein [Nocardioides daeguensis]MBV6729475.1 isoprenylcysteine carboxylmethyltransferase family protein [Nocardioides daeguensis]MCR1771752.1 isoprenylcysteine carboxylmethyltransferase family protein [Nocardioides daeguensis]